MLINKPKKYLLFTFYFLFFIFWLFTIREAVLGQLGGTFKTKEVPQEYVELKNFINNQNEFFRTFWIPQRQRFGFFSNKHPAIDSVSLVKVSSSSAVLNWLNGGDAQEQLARLGVRYVIVPYDSEGELFLEDRRYSKKQREKIKKQITNISWLKKVDGFGRIDVFETTEYRDHFWIENKEQKTKSREQRTENKEQKTDSRLKWEIIDPTEYKVKLNKVKEPVKLVFSERFDKRWEMKVKSQKSKVKSYASVKTDDGLNSFKINETGDLNITVQYEPQSYVNYGVIISGITLFFVISFLLFKKL